MSLIAFCFKWSKKDIEELKWSEFLFFLQAKRATFAQIQPKVALTPIIKACKNPNIKKTTKAENKIKKNIPIKECTNKNAPMTILIKPEINIYKSRIIAPIFLYIVSQKKTVHSQAKQHTAKTIKGRNKKVYFYC